MQYRNLFWRIVTGIQVVAYINLINLQIKERQQKQESVHKNPIFPETEANNP